MSVDQHEQLSKDMLEQVRIIWLSVVTMVTCKQLLKYVPTSEETELLNGHSEEYTKFAKADRFLYEMSQIHHYKERIICLFYKKKFNERMGEVMPTIEAVLMASKEVRHSRRLKKMLEVLLAFGNYMNKGSRGNAYGEFTNFSSSVSSVCFLFRIPFV